MNVRVRKTSVILICLIALAQVAYTQLPLLPLGFPKLAIPKPSPLGIVETSASLTLSCMSRLRAAAL